MLKGERAEGHFASREGCCFHPSLHYLFALQCAQGLLKDPAQSTKGLSGLVRLRFMVEIR